MWRVFARIASVCVLASAFAGCGALVGADFDGYSATRVGETLPTSDGDGGEEPDGAGTQDGSKADAAGDASIAEAAPDTPLGCGPQTCAGCCSNGTCEPGSTKAMCGGGGALCKACPVGQGCASNTCKPTSLVCIDDLKAPAPSCAQVCAAVQKTCVSGCFNNDEIVGVTQSQANCAGDRLYYRTECALPLPLTSALSARCCCA
jgi:hypothetical protein